MTSSALLALTGIGKVYPPRQRGGTPVTALADVSLSIAPGECLGLVGESGSGKTTLTRLILQLERPTTGHIAYEGRDISTLSSAELKELRAKMQVVFQDPQASLNPRMTVHDLVAEPFIIHAATHRLSNDDRTARVVHLLETVGLKPEHLYRFPHEFSGGQRQRICIARALALEPRLLILDEPTSALDVSVQAQVLNMLFELQHRLGLTYLFISHDLGVVRYVADRVALIHHGRIVETGDTERVFTAPESDYARMLLAAQPNPDRYLARTA